MPILLMQKLLSLLLIGATLATGVAQAEPSKPVTKAKTVFALDRPPFMIKRDDQVKALQELGALSDGLPKAQPSQKVTTATTPPHELTKQITLAQAPLPDFNTAFNNQLIDKIYTQLTQSKVYQLLLILHVSDATVYEPLRDSFALLQRSKQLQLDEAILKQLTMMHDENTVAVLMHIKQAKLEKAMLTQLKASQHLLQAIKKNQGLYAMDTDSKAKAHASWQYSRLNPKAREALATALMKPTQANVMRYVSLENKPTAMKDKTSKASTSNAKHRDKKHPSQQAGQASKTPQSEPTLNYDNAARADVEV